MGQNRHRNIKHFGESMKIAIVADFLQKIGGSQKVVYSLHKIYPDAPIYCLLYDEEGTKGLFKNAKIITTELQKYPKSVRHHPKILLNKYAKAVEQFDLSNFDVVISSSDSFAHGIITKPTTLHICYCHTPMRYAWDWTNEYLSENKIGYGLKGLYVRNVLHQLRQWDKVAADRVDFYIANSKNVQARIAKYYQLDSEVITPPVDISQIKIATESPKDYYLVVSRLEPYKKIEIAIEAFNRLGKKLIIIGDGSAKSELEKMAKDNIEFVGSKYGAELFDYYKNAKAFIFPGEEDFGITPLESMASGRPVIAYKIGGTLETIIPDKTGIFFDEQTADSLIEAIEKLEKNYDQFKTAECRHQS